MKNFINFKEFWNYFSTCHLCGTKENFFLRFLCLVIESDSNKILDVISTASNFVESENKLYLQIDFKEGKSRNITETNFIIDCINNTYTFKNLKNNVNINSISFSRFCKSCKNYKKYYDVDTLDIKFYKGKISNYDLYQETYEFILNKITYNFCIDHIEKDVVFSKIEKGKEDKYIHLPMTNFDFSDLKKLVSKMEKLNLFS